MSTNRRNTRRSGEAARSEAIDAARRLLESEGPSALSLRAVAREAGNVKAANIVLVGAASRSLPLKEESLKTAIRELFGRKGEAVVAANLKAFDYGRTANS